MEWVTFIVIITIYYASCEDCTLPRPTLVRPEIKLKEDLLIDYDIFEQPKCNNTKGIEVKVDYLIEDFLLSTDEEIMTVYSKNMFEWEDGRLKWDVDKYEGLKTLNVNDFEIWAPSLKLKNKAVDALFLELVNSYTCEVKNTGQVACISVAEHSVMCSTNMKNWPYDEKKCTFTFDDVNTFNQETDVVFKDIDLLFFMQSQSGKGWDIITSNVKTNLSGDHQVSVELYLERKAECLEASIVIPSFIVSVLTLISIFLHVNNDVRLGILCLNLLNHFQISSEISENIPKYGFEVPVILHFVSLSTIWTVCIELLTFILRYISKLTTPPPSFLVFINSLVLNSAVRHFVIPRWNVEMLNKSVLDSLNHSTEWIDFANIVNSSILYVTLVMYIVLFSIYMPHGTPYISTNVSE